MYEYVFKELGFRLPFSDFHMGLLASLRLSLSQLHPNAFAFMHLFETVYDFLGIGATVSLFLRCFPVQRQMSEGRFGWVSFKNADTRLFKMYTNSVKDFKDRYYVIQPINTTISNRLFCLVPLRDEAGEPTRDEYGVVQEEFGSVFPFCWWEEHFDAEVKEYFYTDDKLDEEDLAAHAKICRYVERFTPTYWVTRTDEPIMDEAQGHLCEAREIDTKALLGCKSEADAYALLGCFQFIFSPTFA